MTQKPHELASASDITFFVACYNEEANILETLNTLLTAVRDVGCTYDIVVMDDASRDRTVPIIKEFMVGHPEVPLRLVVNQANQGLGANYAEAAFHGQGKYYRLIVGDNEERLESIIAALRHLGEADMILTYHADTSARAWSRRLISRSFTGLVNLLGGHHVKYYNGLAIHLRQYVLRWHSHAHGFGFQADLICRLLDLGATYLEVPVVPKERITGVSKAFTFKNIASVGHTLLEVFIRRVARALYPQHMGSLQRGIEVFDSQAYREARHRQSMGGQTRQPASNH